MDTKDKALRAVIELGGVNFDLMMAIKHGDDWHIRQARAMLQRALVTLSDAPEPGTASPINGE